MAATKHKLETEEEREARELGLSQLTKVERELGFLILGVVFGAVLGILGNLWVAFLVELVKCLIPPESWTVASFLGVVIATVLSIYVLIKVIGIAEKYIRGEERLADKTEKKGV